MRTQFSHVIDVAPTILEAVGLPELKMENVFLNVKNKSKTIIAEIEVPASGAHGTILAQGGRFGGWSLYVKDGIPAYDYNFLGLQRSSVAATKPLAPGKATIRFDFAYDGGGLGKGGRGMICVNDEKVAEGRSEHTQPAIFSADETADVGIDLGTPVVEAIGSEGRSRFTGNIPRVTIQELAQQKSHPPTGPHAQMEQRVVEVLRNGAQMRTAFINRVAAPIANKLFEGLLNSLLENMPLKILH
jgi:hypothetical protein